MTLAEGETSVAITVYSRIAPTVLAVEGSVGPVTYNDATHLFRVPVMAGNGNSANIRIREPLRPLRGNSGSVQR